MATPSDVLLAAKVQRWLDGNGCGATQIVDTADACEVHYTLRLDMKPQPPVRVKDGSISFPKGSQEDVVFAFLMQQ